jgi:hypothetical protein
MVTVEPMGEPMGAALGAGVRSLGLFLARNHSHLVSVLNALRIRLMRRCQIMANKAFDPAFP